MPETAWLFPRVNGSHAGHTSVGLGTAPWYATERVRAADDSASTTGPPFSPAMASGVVTEWLRSEDFRPTIPDGGAITGLSVRVRLRRASGGIQLGAIALRRQGLYLAGSVRRPLATVGGSYVTLTYGGDRDKWGQNLTAAMLADSTFGPAVQCRSTAAGSVAEVDYVQIQVHYNTDQTIQPPPAIAHAVAGNAGVVLGDVSVTPPGAIARAVAGGTPVLGPVSVTPPGAVASAVAGNAGVVVSTERLFPALPAVAKAVAGNAGAVLGSISVTPPGAVAKAVAGNAGAFLTSVTVSPPGAVARAVVGGTPVITTFVHPPPAIARAVAGNGGVRIVWDSPILFDDFERNSQQTVVKAYPYLVTISHPGLALPERFTDAGVPLESNGELYQALPIDVRLPSNGRNQSAEGQISLPIQSARVRGLYRTLGPPRSTVLIQMCYGDDPDRIAMEWTMRMGAAQTANGWLTAALDDGDFERQDFPMIAFDGRFPGVHD